MGKIAGFGGEQGFLNTYNFSGVTLAATPQLVVPRQLSRSWLLLQNVSDTDMRVDWGPARALATITSGAVASIAVTNAGFGYTKPPLVRVQGGGPFNQMVSGSLQGGAGASQPANPALASARLTTGAVSSIVVDAPGSGYSSTAGQGPYVYLENDPQDPYGCAAPSATTGFLLKAAGANILLLENSLVHTDPISIFCASADKRFECSVVL